MTRNRIYYGFLLALCVSLALIFEIRLTYTLLVAAILFPAVSFAFTAVLSRMLEVTVTLSSTYANKGETVAVNVYVKNKSVFPCGHIRLFHLSDHFMKKPEVSEFSVLPFGVWSSELDFYCRFCGETKFGFEKIVLTDYLGLFEIPFRGDNGTLTANLLVYPRIIDIELISPESNSVDLSGIRLKIEDDYSTITDYRNYIPTDSMKRIHWKLTAKKNELIVKKYGQNSDSKAAVILDLNAEQMQLPKSHLAEIELKDRMMESAVSIVNYFANAGQPVDFVYPEEETQTYSVSTPDKIRYVCDVTAAMKFDSPIHASELLNDYELRQAPAIYLILTAKLDGKLYERLQLAFQGGRGVMLFWFTMLVNDATQIEFAENLRKSGVTVYEIAPSKDL